MINCDVIVRAVAAHYDLEPRQIYSHQRVRDVVKARYMAYYLARRMTPLSFPQIARAIGDRDHSTVCDGCKVMEQIVGFDPAVAADAKTLARTVEDMAEIATEEITHTVVELQDELARLTSRLSGLQALQPIAAAVARASKKLETVTGSPAEKGAREHLHKTLNALRTHFKKEKLHA